MSPPRRLPFHNLSAQGRQNLGLAAVLALYGTHIGFEILHGLILRTDYLAFWSAGYIANSQGYAAIYNLETLTRIQEQVLRQFGFQTAGFYPTPFLYLPVFVLPFQLLARLPIAQSFLLWTTLNLAAYFLYMHSFMQRANVPSGRAWRLIFTLLVPYPIFGTFHSGQTNLFLLICAGEFLHAVRKGKSFQAGLWLGGFLLKPQTLLLIIPALVVGRRGKSWLGLTTTATVLLFLSFALVGLAGMNAMIYAWRNDANTSSIDPLLMMNWRMIGTHVQNLLGTAGLGVIGVGAVITTVAAFLLWKSSRQFTQLSFLMAVFGTLAATNAITWHSHIYMLTILAPFVAYFYLKGVFSEALLNVWIFALPSALFLALCLSLLTHVYQLPLNENLTGLLLGTCALFLNHYFLLLAHRNIHGLISSPQLRTSDPCKRPLKPT